MYSPESMGIPGYFGYVAGRYPGIVVDSGVLGASLVADADGINGADCLYIDYNNLVHNCARHATTDRTFPRQEAMFRAVFDHVCAYTAALARMARPRKLLYLGVDGVPPVAKLLQQRKRRFMSAAEAQFKGTRAMWRPSFVTPGTRFMAALSQVLRQLRRDLQKELGIEVVVSSWEADGEGEQKIFADLRSRSPGLNALVYGMDADMLMLGLLHEQHNVVIMRQQQDATMDAPLMEHFQFVVLDHMRGALAKEMKRAPSEAAADYVCLCVLVGNYFLPPLCFLGVDNIPMLLRHAVATGQRLVEPQPASDGSLVRFAALKELLAPLARQEDRLMAAADARYRRAKPPPLPPGVAPKEHAWTFMPLVQKFADVVRPREPGWRLRYAQHLLGGVGNTAKAVEAYLEGVEWTMRYYFSHTTPDSAWSYKFAYSPPIMNLHARLVEQPGLRARWADKHRLAFRMTPEMQLLAVLPPAEHALLPRRMQRIMSDVKHGCVHMYPTAFKIKTYLKSRSWECSPDIPPPDLDLLSAAMRDV